jgi:hypothetical protein
MSGTAGLSAAKNRRSGNEVKFNGQTKQPIPPQQQQQQRGPPPAQQCSQKGGQKQCGVPQQGPPPQYGQQMQMQPPHPLVLLKSHELRLQKIESIISSEPEPEPEYAGDEHYSTLIKDFVAHKEDYELFKQSVKFSEKNMSGNKNYQRDMTLSSDITTKFDKEYKVQSEKISNLEGDILILHRRIDDMYRIITTMTSELASVKDQYEEKFTNYEKKINIFELKRHADVDIHDNFIDKVEEPNIKFEVIE